MKQFASLEGKIKNEGRKFYKSFMRAGVATFVLGAVLLLIGIYSFNSSVKISADTDTTQETAATSDVVLPPVPGEPSRESDTDTTSPTASGEISKTFPAGWSMISGSVLEGYDLKALSSAGLVLYSFNDPAYPNRDWTTYPSGDSSSSITAYAPLGYYVYNQAAEIKVTFTKAAAATKPNDFLFARGWHVLYWPNSVADKNQFLSAVKMTYADDSTQTLAEAISDQKHMASIKIYIINNEKSTEESSLKQLTGEDTTTTISKVPQNSYFWIYLRRTKDRVVGISVSQ